MGGLEGERVLGFREGRELDWGWDGGEGERMEMVDCEGEGQRLGEGNGLFCLGVVKLGAD